MRIASAPGISPPKKSVFCSTLQLSGEAMAGARADAFDPGGAAVTMGTVGISGRREVRGGGAGTGAGAGAGVGGL